MIGSMLRVVLSALLLSAGGAFAAEDPTAALAAYPSCAVPCIKGGFEAGYCAPTNQTCICSDATFQGTVAACVSANCEIPDALTTQNLTLTNCGAPVRDRSGSYITLSNVMVCFAAFTVIVRFAYKIFGTKTMPGLDDWFVLATQIATIPSAIITVHGMTANGLGRDIWTLTADQITHVLRYFYIMAWLYYTQVTLVKLSIITFYMRIFPAREVQRILWGTFIFTVLWGIAYVLATIFQCKPISYFWTKWDGLHEGSCLSINAISWSNSSINIALDLWILAVPIWQIHGLHLHWKKKVGVAFMFCIGTFVTIVSILRLQSLVVLASSANVTWNFYDVSIWSSTEICVGIMCACLPSIRLVLVRCFPFIGGSTARSKGQKYYEYGTGVTGVSGTTASRHRATTGGATFEGQPPSSDSPAAVIMFEKTYDVQFSDDEAKLVQMNDLDDKGKTVVHPRSTTSSRDSSATGRGGR